ncbi:hypothetical protein KUL49_37530 [Alteromonas sp. KUL49]|nr:hypothetical protein KUL49_37530 [Alteromonas sp. KUL49]
MIIVRLLLVKFVVTTGMFTGSGVNAAYLEGCDDPKYHQYIEQRFEYFESRNRRLLNDTQRDYQMSVSLNNNAYQVLTHLSRHIKYSAQFEPIETAQEKIGLAFEHAAQMSIEQKIAGEVYDGFSVENHNVEIARAWIAYRQGDIKRAIEKLSSAIEGVDSALLGAFGPDFDFARQLYRDGHTASVVEYIKQTEYFWTGERPDALRAAWLNMIEAGCKIQFDSIDVITAEQLGLGTVDVQHVLGLD